MSGIKKTVTDITQIGTRNHNDLQLRNAIAAHQAEAVGVLSPYSMNPLDLGRNWKDLGVITSLINTATYLGSGIVILGTGASNIVRSTDYGATWTDLGDFATLYFQGSVYLGNGIVLLGHASGDIYRSTDYGLTWTNLGTITGESDSMCYLQNGIVLVGDGLGDIYRSTDYGATWGIAYRLKASAVKSLCYTDNGIVIAGIDDGYIFRSTDYGATWTNLGAISDSAVDYNDITYLGDGVVLFGDYLGHIFRSTDYGATWTDLGIIAAAGGIKTICYIGNGIALAGSNMKLYRSTDYGLTWQNLGNISSTGIVVLLYLGNGITIFGDFTGHVFRNDVSSKIDESQATPIQTIKQYAAGTAYSLTATPALLDFGTTDPSITLNSAGTYLLKAKVNLKYNSATFAANQTVTLKLRRTNNTAADISNSSTALTTGIVTLITETFAVIELPDVIYTTSNSNDIIQIFGGVSVVPGAGSLDAVEASIIAMKLY